MHEKFKRKFPTTINNPWRNRGILEGERSKWKLSVENNASCNTCHLKHLEKDTSTSESSEKGLLIKDSSQISCSQNVELTQPLQHRRWTQARRSTLLSTQKIGFALSIIHYTTISKTPCHRSQKKN